MLIDLKHLKIKPLRWQRPNKSVRKTIEKRKGKPLKVVNK